MPEAMRYRLSRRLARSLPADVQSPLFFVAAVLVVGMLVVALTTSPALASTFTSFDVPGSTGTEGLSINPAGEITGVYRDSGYRDSGFTIHGGGFVRDGRRTFITMDLPDA